MSDNPATMERWDATPLTIIPLEINLSSDGFELCPDSSFVLFPVPDTTGLQFQWGDGSSNHYLEINTAGDYAVTISGGCEMDSATFQVIETPLSVFLGPDLEGQFGDQIDLRPDLEFLSPITLYDWEVNEPSFFTCDTCQLTELDLLSDATVSLYVENEVGCHSMDELNIIATRKVYYPNAFSPNGDGINDWFYIQSKHDLAIISFQVFNRWGGLVFDNGLTKTNDETMGWDGTSQGKPLGNGIYTWLAKIEFPDGVNVIYQGDVLLSK